MEKSLLDDFINKSVNYCSNSLGIYIHVPFCKSKCFYCSFYSEIINEELIQKYLLNLKREFVQRFTRNSKCKVITVYIGGGNPTAIGYKSFLKLLDIIFSHIDIENICEFNIETNPETLSNDICQIIKDLPNLRINIGFQRLDDDELKYLGRNSTVLSSIAALERSLAITNNVGLDFIVGVPEFPNTLKPKLKSLLKRYDIKHISTYFLTLEENTTYEKLVDCNKRKNPEDADVSEYYDIIELLEGFGYHHYEISNFAKRGYKCKHNLKYWLQKDYLGLGPAAVSTISNIRIANAANLLDWIAKKNFKVELLDEKIQQEEFIMLRLRLVKRGFSISEFKKKFGRISQKFLYCIKRKIQNSELLINSNNQIIIPKQKIIYSNKIIRDLFEGLE